MLFTQSAQPVGNDDSAGLLRSSIQISQQLVKFPGLLSIEMINLSRI